MAGSHYEKWPDLTISRVSRTKSGSERNQRFDDQITFLDAWKVFVSPQKHSFMFGNQFGSTYTSREVILKSILLLAENIPRIDTSNQ